MPKYLTSPSPNKKIKYAAHPAKAIANKLRKMKKHVKKHPKDLQAQDPNYKPSYPKIIIKGQRI